MLLFFCVCSLMCICEVAHVLGQVERLEVNAGQVSSSISFENDPSLNLELTSSQTWACQEVRGVLMSAC